MEFVAESPAPDGSITGRFIYEPKENLSEILARFLEPSKQGKVFTHRPGPKPKYIVTNLTLQGTFKLVPVS
jgi:hypothetical protein